MEIRESAQEKRNGACICAKLISQSRPAIMFAIIRRKPAMIGYFPAICISPFAPAASRIDEEAPRNAKRARVICIFCGREKERAAIEKIMHPVMNVFFCPRVLSRSCTGNESAAWEERKIMYASISWGGVRIAAAFRRKRRIPIFERRKMEEKINWGEKEVGKSPGDDGEGFILGRFVEYLPSFFTRKGIRARNAGIAERRIMLR